MPSNSSPPSDPSRPSHSSSPFDSPPDDSRSFGDRLGDGFERAGDHLPLAAVPLVASLLSVDSVQRVLDFRDGYHLGLTFRFPAALPDLWTFVSLPNKGPGVHVSSTLFLLPVLIPVQAVLVAGLLGSVHEALQTGEYDFPAAARRYFVPVLVFVALVRVAGLAAFSVGAAAPPMLFVLFPAFIVLSYVFYATPYLLVVADSGVEEALLQSYEWAMDGGPYFAYGAGYLLFVAAVSVVGTAVVVNVGAVGILVGAIASAPVALALTFATTEFVAEMAGSGGRGGFSGGEVGGGQAGVIDEGPSDSRTEGVRWGRTDRESDFDSVDDRRQNGRGDDGSGAGRRDDHANADADSDSDRDHDRREDS